LSPIRALVFDFDGLVVDTESPAYVSWQEIYSEHGQELEIASWADAIGTVEGFDPVSYLEQLCGVRLDRGAVAARRRERKLELSDREPLRPGVRAYLEDAAKFGIATAIASSDTSDWVWAHLTRLGLAEGWAAVECADGDRGIAKPAPHLYEAVLERLGVEASEAIALEDSPNGIAAAKAAGLFCVAVPNPVTVNLRLFDADMVLPSLEAMPLGDLIEHVHT
jgi:HAD superfamily hydrolase (TIGR01509 family)